MLELSRSLSVELEVSVRYDLQWNPRRLPVVRLLHIPLTWLLLSLSVSSLPSVPTPVFSARVRSQFLLFPL